MDYKVYKVWRYAQSFRYSFSTGEMVLRSARWRGIKNDTNLYRQVFSRLSHFLTGFTQTVLCSWQPVVDDVILVVEALPRRPSLHNATAANAALWTTEIQLESHSVKCTRLPKTLICKILNARGPIRLAGAESYYTILVSQGRNNNCLLDSADPPT